MGHLDRFCMHILPEAYVECVDDCRKSIKADPTGVKPYYRAARACFQMSLFKECLKYCDRGLDIDGDNEPIKAVRAMAVDKQPTPQKTTVIDDDKICDMRIQEEMKKRGLTYERNKRSLDIPSHIPLSIHISPNDSLVYGALLLYGELNTSDIVNEWGEEQSVQDILQVVLCGTSFPPGDSGRYIWDTVHAYIEGASDRDECLVACRKSGDEGDCDDHFPPTGCDRHHDDCGNCLMDAACAACFDYGYLVCMDLPIMGCTIYEETVSDRKECLAACSKSQDEDDCDAHFPPPCPEYEDCALCLADPTCGACFDGRDMECMYLPGSTCSDFVEDAADKLECIVACRKSGDEDDCDDVFDTTTADPGGQPTATEGGAAALSASIGIATAVALSMYY
eukprot:GHVO01032654.1.p1 GENE.GHVO01032654.1~~GHVO01032654.1.p1  ORF type:complete len:394 (-),score=73.49 GHVO01032654.1:153-1334(-)